MRRHGRPLAPRSPQPAYFGVAIAVALALTLGAPAAAARHVGVDQQGEPAPTSIAPHLSCLVAGDEVNTLYGVYPTTEARCPNGLAVDLGLLRAAMGLP